MQGMTGDELETLLRAWGKAYGERPPVDEYNDRRPTPAVHPLARGMVFAPGKKVRHLDLAYRRMIRKGERSWSRDPIVCSETRPSGGGGSCSAVTFTPAVERVQSAVTALDGSNAATAMVLRAQYCKRGSRADRIAWVDVMGHKMGGRTYIRHLVEGRKFVAKTT